MHINNPHLKKLAEGRTEITTKMICEAERLEDAQRLEYMQLLAQDAKSIYGTVYRQANALEAFWESNGWCVPSYTLGIPHPGYGLGRCPYCGK